MKKLNIFYRLSFLVLAFLLVYTGYLTYKAFRLPQQVDAETHSLVHTHLDVGDEVFFSFATRNEESQDLHYTYYFYLDEELVNNRTALVPRDKEFGYGYRFNPSESGINKIRLVVYREDQPEPIHDITRYVSEPEEGF